MLEEVVLLNIFVETVTAFIWNESEYFTFEPFNISLLNKIINLYY